MDQRFPFPKRYWFYVCIVFICSILLIGNIFRTDSWTGGKPFSEFVHREWVLFAIFLAEEFVIAGVMFLFVFLSHRVSRKRDQEIAADWERNGFQGIKPGDYDYVWFDFSHTERALILKQKDQYMLYVEEYDAHTGNWQHIGGVSVCDSLEAVKKALFYDCDFYCEENAAFDKHGDEIFKEA